MNDKQGNLKQVLEVIDAQSKVSLNLEDNFNVGFV